MKGVAKKVELLVTDTERTTKLHELLGKRFTNHGQLLLPTFGQYEALTSDEGLLALTKDMCRWLGYKPRSLHVRFGVVTNSSHAHVEPDLITINQDFKNHPLVTGGILARAVIEFVAGHHHFIADERFIEVNTIESGLGLWLINAFQPKASKREKLYHLLDSTWLQHEGLQLQTMSVAEYLRQFTIFTSVNHLFPEDYGRNISKRSSHLLPATSSATKITPMLEPSTTLTHVKNANGLWLRIGLLASTLAIVCITGVVLWTQRNTPIPHDQTRDSASLRVIKSSLSDCIQMASDQQSKLDPNDLFMTRQIDATKARCESLRNQYNDALSTYEDNYPQPN